ncbi:deoxyguanosinetriphosphate triphosphohydrolase [Leptospira biflexa]|uniref:deoxyguanosinetriphosphate triphosphohydrolase n=1 Tax=Leptospira biflexa TaxID=172 RepID=UPI001083C1A6|nr:deoxyguanosinetriphosphate triphosphohydrolase [Leptospira biflexa]TGM34261.1 deoxyguanosinetriphosphate triphosphohydrolase [Leptospira biflexa]TGM40082.1 deoxyguanosinetriphosphate triphosphohydrolase [Leptospira biflexa]TGM48320.1 deoxyguanosinetriphosphate triphosphohydrolase [Leptospira biflexa]TGM49214.1 deoxyguanosinetriphosphate triphosphohydrolase [Leptospira biflexa]TGM54481.1 deoxyguanosinetriphosphate triphosphohydrolase [Leptospira biflexa]
MKKGRNELLNDEEKILAPYAVGSRNFGGRAYEEPEHPYRLPFQRDKDRIIHSHAFKRLEYKTQVFVYSEGDHFRNRLTHTLEVAGISKTISKVLGLNEDLSESIALAHDLGHSPFGHAGQEALAELMKDIGGFEHNKQSLRVVQKLERRYPNFPGLNLCEETLLGIMKHGGGYESSNLLEVRRTLGPSLEAMIVDASDEITYSAHDLEDGLESGLLQLEEVKGLMIWKRIDESLPSSEKNSKTEMLSISRSIGRISLNLMVSDLIESIHKILTEYSVNSRESISKLYQKKIKIVQFSEEFQKEFNELKQFLFQNLYRHSEVSRMSERGKETIYLLFKHFETHPESIPESYRNREEEDGRMRVICDYIAGMTDRYAIEKLKREGILWFPY